MSPRYSNGEHFKSESGYEVNGVWYPRVTKILEIKSKPALENFLKEMENYSSAEDVKNKSAAEGTLVHNTVEKLAIGEKVEIPEEIKPAVLAFQKLKEERGIIFLPEFVECRIWSFRHRYAGTVDALASVNGKLGVLDIKTSPYFYPEYNLQTASYLSALQEFEVKRALGLPGNIETRWILRINQHRVCKKCGAKLRKKGGRSKVRNGKPNGVPVCVAVEHEWGEPEGDVEIKEFPYFYKDLKAFVAAKILWEWENSYWLRQIGYI